ncbi:hypothetical protein GCM10010082_05370 [Kushneria pakistanensis]|uniref:General stress protein CsbD n=1 Tax=Kushneria pakistanensis TaxID=1508770 RepID=A0ABQ3FBT5_9GAMM|nr:hypothetical protein [Kushneria pakistanensis]GHC17229.1 hypothetical protein GCM10010082_05370 [Kushneria pakistanensis]
MSKSSGGQFEKFKGGVKTQIAVATNSDRLYEDAEKQRLMAQLMETKGLSREEAEKEAALQLRNE